jgi:chemotaxis protein methyltransferase CheR
MGKSRCKIRGFIVLALAQNRDLVFTAGDFERIRAHIHRRAGIVLGPHKREMAYSRLAKRLRALALSRFVDYLALLESDPTQPEWEEFTNALTTNFTGFFREAYHFPLLAAHVRHRPAPVVWCCAASTGEEAYSIAITLSETLGGRTGQAHAGSAHASSARVLATDIDTRALAVGKRGLYPLAAVEKLGEQRLRRFFLKGVGLHAGWVRVRDDLRAMIAFRSLNLLAPDWALSGPFDAIFCRNLMIYFDCATQRALLARFAGLLKPDGLLFVGHSESFSRLSAAFRLRRQTVYERVAPGLPTRIAS